MGVLGVPRGTFLGFGGSCGVPGGRLRDLPKIHPDKSSTHKSDVSKSESGCDSNGCRGPPARNHNPDPISRHVSPWGPIKSPWGFIRPTWGPHGVPMESPWGSHGIPMGTSWGPHAATMSITTVDAYRIKSTCDLDAVRWGDAGIFCPGSQSDPAKQHKQRFFVLTVSLPLTPKNSSNKHPILDLDFAVLQRFLHEKYMFHLIIQQMFCFSSNVCEKSLYLYTIIRFLNLFRSRD